MPDTSGTQTAGETPYDERLNRHNKFRRTPRCVYFYYIGEPDSSGNREVRHYYYTNGNKKIRKNDIIDIIRNLADNARQGNSSPPKYGCDWKGIVWTRKSYFVIYIDDTNVQTAPDKELLEFDYLHGGTENHSFFDAQDIRLDGRLVVWCINHMKKNDLTYDDLEEEMQRFHFTLNTDPSLRLRFYPDDGGTNMGPPVPPP